MKRGYLHTAGCEPSEFFNTKSKFKMMDTGALKFPGDPLMKPLAEYTFHEGMGPTIHKEVLRFYDSAIFSIQQTDGTFKVWRLD